MLGASFKREHFDGTGMDMAVFDGALDSVRGPLIADKRRKPVADGALVYLHAPDLDASLSRTEKAGGVVAMPKTDIGPPGFIARVRDTEGTSSGFTLRAEGPWSTARCKPLATEVRART